MSIAGCSAQVHTRTGWARSFLIVLLALVLLPALTFAQSSDPSLEAYQTLLRTASAAAQRGDRLGLEQAAEPLIRATAVTLSDGVRAPVDNRWLAEALRPTDPDFTAIAAQLGAILDAITLPEGAAPADALARLQQLLANPPFANRQTDTAWLDAIWNWISGLIDSLLRPFGSSIGTGSRVAAWVLGGIGVLLLAAVLLYLALSLRRSLVRDTHVAEDPEANLTAKAALDQANDLSRSGDHRTAMRYLYLSALLWLDERDLLRYDRALTNREYLERARNNPALRGKLAPVIETFDRVWYGNATLDDQDFAAYKAQVDALRMETKS